MLTFAQPGKQAATNAVTALVTVAKITTSGGTVLATFSTLAYGAADVNGKASLTIDGTCTTTATSTGTASLAKFFETGGATLAYTCSVGQKVNITGINQGAKTITVAEDKSAVAWNQKITISGSTGNDGVYTVVSVSGSGPTVITVHESLPNATVDGALLTEDLAIDNVAINGPPNAQTVNITSHSITVAP